MNPDVSKAMTIRLADELPPEPVFDPQYRRAPNRGLNLNQKEIVIAVKNALRYVPRELHEKLAPEFLNELMTCGRIYAYRYRPQGAIKAKPVDEYKGILEARALQLMIDNNLDFDIALYPYELTTYGESGQVCQNWMQFQVIKKYLETMTEEQTLVVSSGHPIGLFPTKRDAPRVISTNGLMVGMFDTPEDFHRAAAMVASSHRKQNSNLSSLKETEIELYWLIGKAQPMITDTNSSFSAFNHCSRSEYFQVNTYKVGGGGVPKLLEKPMRRLNQFWTCFHAIGHMLPQNILK